MPAEPKAVFSKYQKGTNIQKVKFVTKIGHRSFGRTLGKGIYRKGITDTAKAVTPALVAKRTAYYNEGHG